MKREYRSWLNVTPEGEIVSVVHRLGNTAPTGHPVLNPTPSLDGALARSGGKAHWLNGAEARVEVKRPVRLRASRRVAGVGEVIVVSVDFLGQPPAVLRATIGHEPAALDPEDPLEVRWADPADVIIELDEVRYTAAPLTLHWRNPDG